jgi:hypothetical protein
MRTRASSHKIRVRPAATKGGFSGAFRTPARAPKWIVYYKSRPPLDEVDRTRETGSDAGISIARNERRRLHPMWTKRLGALARYKREGQALAGNRAGASG